MPLILRPPGLTDNLPQRLTDLGRTRKLESIAFATSRCLTVCLMLTAAWLFLDSLVHLPSWLRVVGLSSIVVTAAILSRYLAQALATSTDPLAVALRLEANCPELNDALGSAISFITHRQSHPTVRAATRFEQATLSRAETILRRYQLEQLAPANLSWFWLYTAALFVGVTIILLGVALMPETMTVGVLRLADPYGPHQYPTKTRIEILEPADNHGRIARGQPFKLRFRVTGVIPDAVLLRLRTGDGAFNEHVFSLPGHSEPSTLALADLVDEGNQQGLATIVVDPSRVQETFSFQLLAYDFASEWRTVQVVSPPSLVPRDGRPSPQIHLVYPEYTGLPPADLPDGTGMIEAVAGTQVTFRAAADRRIIRAELFPESDLMPFHAAIAAAAVVADHPLAALSARSLLQAYTQPILLTCSGPDGTQLEGEFTPRISGLYSLRITDETGLTGVRQFHLELFADPVPRVQFLRPDASTDSLTLLPTATVTIQGRAEDRNYAVRSLDLEYRFLEPDSTWEVMPLVDLPTARNLAAAVIGQAPAQARGDPKPALIETTATIPVSRLRKRNGTPAADGDRILLRLSSTDWDDYAWCKGRGRSEERELHILSLSSIEALLQRELAAMRPELLRLQAMQQNARKAVEQLRDTVSQQSATEKPVDPGKVAAAEQQQRQIRNVIADSRDGLTARANRLCELIQKNQLPITPTTERLEATVEDLQRLANQFLPAAEPPLSTARQELERSLLQPGSRSDRGQLSALLQRAEKHQRSAESTLAAILERLEQWAGAGEIRGESRALKADLQQTELFLDAARTEAGKDPAALTPQKKAVLESTADRFDQLAERSGALISKAARIAAEKERMAADLRAAAADKEQQANEIDSNPSNRSAAEADAALKRLEASEFRDRASQAQTEADALRAALDAAAGQALARELRDAAEAIRKNQPERARAASRQAQHRLDLLAEQLAESAQHHPEELRKKRDQVEDQLDHLGARQDELNKKIHSAAQELAIPHRGERFKELAQEQDLLRRQAELLAEKLNRDRSAPTAEALRRAAEWMEASREKLQQGELPTRESEESLQQLSEALNRLDQQQQQTDQQLLREQELEITTQLRMIRDRQAAAIQESTRLHKMATDGKAWTRPLLASLADLEDRQRILAEDLRKLISTQLDGSAVFTRLATQSATAMARAAELAAERREDLLAAEPGTPFDGELERLAEARLLRPMTTALRRLEQILAAISSTKPEAPPEGRADEPQAPAPPADPSPGSNAQTLRSVLMQLKALRALQAEVNERTAEFARLHPDPSQYTDDDRQELRELEQTQREISELFAQLADLFQSAME